VATVFPHAASGQPPGVATLVERAIAQPFRLGSAIRRARIFHPEGFLCRGTWTVETTPPVAADAQVLRAGARHDVVARLSRGAGLPESLPDWFAVAVRLVDAYGPDRHQDLLINASSGLPALHHLFLPAPRWFAQSYSTCLPYRAGGGPFLIGLLPPPERGPDPSRAAMRAAVAAGVTFRIAVAHPLGRWQPIGTLALREPIPGDEDFDPWHTGGGLVPAGWLNRLRREAYRQSRIARGRPG
jgi:hypothetical protein